MGGIKVALRTVLAGLLFFSGALTLSLIAEAPTASAHPKPSPPSITTFPIQVVETAYGAVSYRSDGSGSPLVMIMGFGGSQDAWPPALVDALAVNHRVIIFDNAGIGQTAMPPDTLTISTMADQTAALIEALGLGQPAVLGWSMGGMIAQALANRHPGDLSRLVLCATVPGDGTATVPSTVTINQLVDAVTTGNTSELMPLLFPADQVTTQGPAYVAAILSYPNLYVPSAAVDEAQISAAESWMAGTDSGGYGAITVPSLIGDGADDVLTPPINSKNMKKSIPGAKFVNYPDAGHGFVVQDAAKWSKKINKFLA